MNKNTSSLSILVILVTLLSLHTTVFANDQSDLIPVIDNASVFARFTDEMPMVVNYFTLSTEDQIISFYQEHYGQILMREVKRSRLTLSFQHNDQQIRVIISQQDKKRQVDVIVENKG